MIEMSDGRSVPIETIKTGDLVSNHFDHDGFALTVVDTLKGIEIPPMVRIEDERGKSLLMTAKHPIDVVGRGMVMAERLKVGDVVTTKNGPSRLVSVTREKYTGSVHNLRVGSGSELQGVGADSTTVYANGFLVGDSQVQAKYESIELATTNRPNPLPMRWRKDYLNSAKH